MDLSSIAGNSPVYSVDTSQAAQSSTPVAGDPAPSDVSKMGDLMKQLQQLSQSDPTKFKQVMSEISDKLKSEAGDSTGKKADFLNALAGKFEQASQSGNMSAFQPPQGAQQGGAGGAHHHGHHAHVASYASSSSQTSPADSLEQVIESALQDTSTSAS